ncbi:hypothetical protein Poli38472_008262 [Pythium oligandrum]|uniref:Uncharacterized protein n=1 Tax=Pythium oligandrum TaxID=41045 RepID=A0A8K1CLT2_PYTOL|nr:hypothetical protein Poli38472_008262 [Pythium oligandrum]|eukprot:TMW65620.1 hypothetical protein Poli38472_008262 [Pythium oligandrum]
MSLLCDYSDSSASEDEEEQTTPQTETTSSELPSVDDLFSGNAPLTASRYPPKPAMAMADATKRRASDGANESDAKRARTEKNPVEKPIQSAKAKPALPFAPPQLKRPNVSTEDVGAWNTQRTIQHQEQRKQKTPSDS